MLDHVSDDDFAAAPISQGYRQLVRLSLLLWALGMPGVVAVAWYLGRRAHSSLLPEWALPLLGALQGSLLLAATAFFGAWLAPRVGLGAPMLGSLVDRRGRWIKELQQMWLAGVGGGVMGAAWMITLSHLISQDILPGDPVQALPMWIKLLYSGITEELLARWGVMSMVMFVLWRVACPRGGPAPLWVVWLAIVLAAVVGAVLNFPVAAALMGGLTPELGGYVLLNYTAFGLLAGYIYWRHGLGAAIVAHTLALTMSHGLT